MRTYADIPSRMQKKHLVHVAMYLRVCIHVLCYEAMGKEIIRYGEAKGTLHLYIYRQECHYHPVYKVHRLPASRTGGLEACSWCDFCCKLVRIYTLHGKAHIIKCHTKANEDPATTLEKDFLAKWKVKHQPAFRYPPAHKPRWESSVSSAMFSWIP
jgi:hypothetical protein